MFRLTAPSDEEINGFISQQQLSRYSYPDVGASASTPPSQYTVDQNRVLLGTGEAAWKVAVDSIREWQMFNLSWVRLCWPTAPIQVGTDVAVLVHHLGFYSLNACRIVHVVEEDEPVKRFGFAYGTLLDHAESGEERFTVEWNQETDDVWYAILAFSRPNKFAAKLGYPLTRSLQRKFAEDSKAAMRKAFKDA